MFVFSTNFLTELAASHHLLVQSDWRAVPLRDLVNSQLAHLGDMVGTRITIDGPPLRLLPAAIQTLGMAIHELATNAQKYGALSNAIETVDLGWAMDGGGQQKRFKMYWREQGGQGFAPTTRRGFGHSVTITMVEHALDADVSLADGGQGPHWQISAPAVCVVDEALEEGSTEVGP